VRAVLAAASIALASLVPIVGAADASNAADDAYAKQLSDLVNAYRMREGASSLAIDAGLAALAREHSAAMAKAGQPSHDGFPSRVARSGYRVCVENVGWNYPTPAAQLDGWQHSPEHDKNLRDPRIRRMGIAVVGSYATFIACQ
jgi:uncharacterized protein YkwD